MTGVSVSGSMKPVLGALDRIAAIGRNPAPVLEAASLSILNNTRHRMEAGEDPSGVRWETYAPLNPLYASDKKGPGILRESQGLYNSLTSVVRGSSLIWGSNKIYAAVHQFGGTIRAKDAPALRFHMGGYLFLRQSVRMPARPYLGFTQEDREDLLDNLEGFLARAVRG